MIQKSSIALLSASLLLGGVLTACGGPVSVTRSVHSAAHGVANTNKSITMETNGDVNFNLWNPNAFANSDLVDPLIFSGLTKDNLEGLPSPDLATSWHTADHGLEWVFNLRKGVRWQDGKPFTATDVLYTFNDVVLNPKLGANGASNYSDVTRVTANGPYQVIFHLKQPWSSLPAYLTYFAPILPAHILAKEGANVWNDAQFSTQHPIGTGPYEVQSVQPGQSITLVRNPYYFGRKPSIPKIVFQIIPQETTVVSDLLNGDLNFAEVNDPQLVSELKSDPSLTVSRVSEQIYYDITLNGREAPFNNVLVRRALEYAINRPAIIQGLLKGYGQVANGPIAPIQKYFYDPHVMSYPYDPAKAIKLLEAAGMKKGPGGKMYYHGKPFTINMPTAQYGFLVPLTELVQQYWKAIGVTANIHVMDFNSWTEQVVLKHDFGAMTAWWVAPLTPDVYPYFATSTINSGYNIQGIGNARLDALMTQLRETTNLAQQKRLADAIQVEIAKLEPMGFLFYPEEIDVTSRNLYVPPVNYDIALDNVADWHFKS
ncbi:MAG: ABC transporter substrate-binding protein [Firmicutes bacterium]|nr:ABC transporter substrate-binding protein [Bacillota bacterium]